MTFCVWLHPSDVPETFKSSHQKRDLHQTTSCRWHFGFLMYGGWSWFRFLSWMFCFFCSKGRISFHGGTIASHTADNNERWTLKQHAQRQDGKVGSGGGFNHSFFLFLIKLCRPHSENGFYHSGDGILAPCVCVRVCVCLWVFSCMNNGRGRVLCACLDKPAPGCTASTVSKCVCVRVSAQQMEFDSHRWEISIPQCTGSRARLGGGGSSSSGSGGSNEESIPVWILEEIKCNPSPSPAPSGLAIVVLSINVKWVWSTS